MISVVVPVYGAEKTLKKCICSIFSSPYRKKEVILVDDGTKDGSCDICDSYASMSSNVIVVHKNNGGVSSARNSGIEIAKGEYICFVDSDDSIEPLYFDTLVIAKDTNPFAGSIWCGYRTVHNQNNECSEPHLLSTTEVYSRFSRTDYMYLYNSWYTQMPWHRLYKYSVIMENKIRFTKGLSLGEDLIFNLDYLDAVGDRDIVVANKVCYNYTRTENDSLDHRYRADLRDIYKKVDSRIYECLTKWDVDEESMQQFINAKFYHIEHVLFNTFHPDNKMSFHDKLKYNNALLRCSAFTELLNKRTCFVHPLYLRAYQSKNYISVLALELLRKLKNRLKDKND